MRKRDAQDAGEDTVEKAVEGLAESILREDAEKRKEELVNLGLFNLRINTDRVGPFQHSTEKGELGSEERHDE